MGNKNWKEWFRALKNGERLPKKNQLLILFLTGVLLLVIIYPIPQGGTETEDGGEVAEQGAGEGTDTGMTGEYEAYLERKTEETLRQVQGVGEVTVMITLKSGGQKIIEKDQSGTTQTTEEEDSSGGTRTVKDSSSEKTSIYTQGKDGSSVPYVSKELTPEIEGVVVIAEGGDDAVAIRNITEAVQALFSVEAHKIKIMKRA